MFYCNCKSIAYYVIINFNHLAFDSLLSDLWIIYCKLCVKEYYNHEISQINSELLATPIQSNDEKIINQLLKSIEHLGKENSELKEKLDFYESKGKVLLLQKQQKKKLKIMKK